MFKQKREPKKISKDTLGIVRMVAAEFCQQNCGPGTTGHHPECLINLWDGPTVDRKLKRFPASSKGQDR